MVAYLTLIGFIVAIVMNKDEKKNSLGNYHLRQMLGLLILGIGGSVIINIVAFALHRVPVVGSLVGLTGWAFQIVLIVAWVLGLIDALNRREKPIPVVGPVIQDKLKNVFAS
ncbi:hypothetical protein llg_13580 [Luteolibacter sp. LG18]|nr:hypothetical protein llg_13580 [Luteolibacter sp. LG18]